MKAFACDKCKKTFQGHPVGYDICMSCMLAVREFLDATDEPGPGPQLPPGDWISIEDAVPAHDRAVHVIVEGEKPLTIWLSEYRDGEWAFGPALTHWKPIKEPFSEPEPESAPPAEQLIGMLRDLANEMERRGVATFSMTDTYERIETTGANDWPGCRTYKRGPGQTMVLGWDWADIERLGWRRKMPLGKGNHGNL